MADNEHQVVLLDTANLAENGEIVTIAHSSGVDGEAVGDDILQQALEEATESYGNTVVEYSPDNMTVVADGSVLSDHNTGNVVVSENSYSLVNVVQAGIESGDIQIHHDTMSVEGQFEAQVVEDVSDTDIEMATGTDLMSTANGTINGDGLVVETSVSTAGPAPLGSSSNPIRIIQQGNQYTSMQQLTPEQLAQIMQVVQEQQLAKTTTEESGSTTLFNPQTQTRIIYRVIYPSELHAKGGIMKPVTIQIPQSMHQQKRMYRKRVKDDDTDKLDGPELSREEKEQRKKQRPRTRAGRVSRPPKHMIQDYKHIHPLDWDEEYDDSDGGYSDFKMSDEEPEEEITNDENFVHGLPTTRPKNFKCDTCGKGYIGQAGLSRHYMIHPEHETGIPNHGRENGADISTDESTQDSVASMSTSTGTPTITVAMSESLPTSVNLVQTSVPRSMPPARGGFVSRGRGRPPHHENTPMRRKARLKDLMRQCEDEELMEVVLPHLAKVITLWEFLLMKVERGRPLKPHVSDIYRQYEQLHKQVSKVCKQYMKPAPATINEESKASPHTPSKDLIEISEEPLAASLGLTPGQYMGQELPVEESTPFTYKYLYATPDQTIPGRSNKRTIELVSPDQLADHQRPRKRGPGRPPKYPRPGGGIRPVTLSPGSSKQVMVVPSRLGVSSSPSAPVSSGMVYLAAGDAPRRVSTAAAPATVTGSPRIIYVQPKLSGTAKPVPALPTLRPASPGGPAPLLQLDTVTGQLIGGAGVLEGHQVLTVTPSSGGQQVLTIGPASHPQRDSMAPGGGTILSMASQPPATQGMVIASTASLTSTTQPLAVMSTQLEGVEPGMPGAIMTQDLSSEDLAAEGTIVLETTEPIDSSHTHPDLENDQQDTANHLIHAEELITTETLVEHSQITQEESVVVPKVESLEAAEHTTPESSSPLTMEVENGIELSQTEILPDSSDFVKVSSEDQVITMEDHESMSAEGLVSAESLMVSTEAMDSKDGVVLAGGLEGGEVLTDGVQQVYLSQTEDGQTTFVNNVFQTEDGLVLIQNPDGTFHIHSDSPIAMETVQALLGIEPGSHVVQEETTMNL